MSIRSQNVLDSPNNNTVFMVWNFKDGAGPSVREAFGEVCGLVAGLNKSADTRFPGANASVVMGIGFEAWQLLDLPGTLPREFERFEGIAGARHTAPSTRGDLHFHIRADAHSFCIDAAAAITKVLAEVADGVEEIHGFRYWDGRSILGFVDGTENPTGAEREYFGIIGDEDPAYKGGSYLFVQKYRHDMQAWNALATEEQEKAIGRTKMHDIELPEDAKPANAHTALANLGDEHKIVRGNMPFGKASTNDMGTYFIAYASSFQTVKEMLRRMFVGEPEGNHDRILDFSTAQTGTLFFAPSLDMLTDFAE